MCQLDQTLTTQLLTKKSASKTPSVQNYTSHCKTAEIPPPHKKKKQLHPTTWLFGSPNYTSDHTSQDFHDVNQCPAKSRSWTVPRAWIQAVLASGKRASVVS